MRRWLVASGLVEAEGGLLLVRNRRRDGRVDWTPPGGVIEVAAGETVRDGLTREVAEESGLTVSEWVGPIWEVEAEAAAMGWRLRVEVHRAVRWDGDLQVNDPDGIVEEARFVPITELSRHLSPAWLPLHEPLTAWCDCPWDGFRTFRYRIDGDAPATMQAVRL